MLVPHDGDAFAAADLSGIRSDGYATLPPQALAGPAEIDPPVAALAAPSGAQGDVPPGQPSGPWSPPGIAKPWPKSEYVRDGGHVGAPLTLDRQGQVRGLQMEDTVAQYETLDGQSHVQPSNPVYLYAPRFGAVRQVTNLQDEVQIDRLRGLHEPVKLSAPTIRTLVTTGQQNLQVGDDVARSRRAFSTRNRAMARSPTPSGPAPSTTATRRSRTSPSFASARSGSRSRPGWRAAATPPRSGPTSKPCKSCWNIARP